ncbi:MobA/MobL family protein [Microvirga sp. BSC39]|uniref:MobA/MobL family protein n=1 Tax=Microvirga sp. BSC39 TaxID=1549810 RepID=UPI00068A1E06|nr:MobA/MobL family protein [Microvirga sp. BSC39]
MAYITRASAARAVLVERMPAPQIGRRGAAARAWLDAQEQQDRKNARVITKLMVALPHELEPKDQAQLVRHFCEALTQGRAPWLAAVHAPSQREGADDRNWHAHIVIRDRDPATGKRVCGLSEKGSTELVRKLWQDTCNAALARAGVAARIDHRSLRELGIERIPEIHVGPKATIMEAKGVRPQSRSQNDNGREIRWPEIDGGQTRAEHRAEIVLEREVDHDQAKRIEQLVAAARIAEQENRRTREQACEFRARNKQDAQDILERIERSRREHLANGCYYERVIDYICRKAGQYLAVIELDTPTKFMKRIIRVRDEYSK